VLTGGGITSCSIQEDAITNKNAMDRKVKVNFIIIRISKQIYAN
jgi:hypothetical protein